MSRSAWLLLLLAATVAGAGETARGVLPVGPAAPRDARIWDFRSWIDAPEEEVIGFLYLVEPVTSARLKVRVAPAGLKALEIYANGVLSARVDGNGVVVARKARGFGSVDEPVVNLSAGLRKGLNRISLLARFGTELEDSVEAMRPGWGGTIVFGVGRLVRLSLLFRGWERIFDFEAALYQTLRRFDQAVRSGHPQAPQDALARGLSRLVDLNRSLDRDQAVAIAHAEADRFYLETWNEPGASRNYLEAQVALGHRVEEHWRAAGAATAAHELYRQSSRMGSLYEALTDVALSKENLRNACSVLATRGGEAAPDSVSSLITLMSQDRRLMDSLEAMTGLVGDAVAGRKSTILKNATGMRETYPNAQRALASARKQLVRATPSRAVVERDAAIVGEYLDQIRGLVRRDLVYSRLLAELAGSLLEPRQAPPSVPARAW